jgi:hypothetical protein
MAPSTQTLSEIACMPASLCFESFGVRIGITVDAPDILDRVVEVLPPGWKPIDAPDLHRRYHIGYGDQERGAGTVIVDGLTRDEVFHNRTHLMDFLEGDIQIHVAEFATPHLFVHAGVVGWRGKAILLPGTSFAGKSTLVTSLVKAGATYYSDEYAVLDDAGRVLPYPRRVSLRTGPHGPARRLEIHNPIAQHPEPIRIGMVAMLRYEAGVQWQVSRVSKADAMMLLCEQTVAIRRRPEDTFAILKNVVDGATVIHGIRGDVDEAVDALLSMEEVRGLGTTRNVPPDR